MAKTSTGAAMSLPREVQSKPEPKDQPSSSSPSPTDQFSLLNIWLILLAPKLLVAVGYHSTDFDVHRNWLAITHNLPLSQWYVEATSQWTLDYPPFFAYFEWFLSQLVPAPVKADGCLQIVPVGNYGLPTIYFQRATVIASELVLFVALQWFINTCQLYLSKKRAYAIAASLALSPGLMLIDHIHFQYNGMMYGILVLMLNCARLDQHLMCGFWFAVLLCFKHIYLYLAPAVFVYLLSGYCLSLKYDNKKSLVNNVVGLIQWTNCLKLGLVVASVFTVAFGPFAYYGVLPQLFSRLFPFSRGLTHAYWAPNIWAIYLFVDRVLIQVYKSVPLSRTILQRVFQFNAGLLSNPDMLNKSTRGIVGDIEFFILPTITPQITFILTLFYQIMALIPLFFQPNYKRFVGALVLCGYASFLFGWHVHEKAILIVIFPITFLVCNSKSLLAPFNLLVSCGYVSLFPLIFTPGEWIFKVTFTFMWFVIFYVAFNAVVKLPKNVGGSSGIMFHRLTQLYILGLVPLILFTSMMDLFESKYEFLRKLEFLKLMLISVYTALGIISSWNGFSWLYFVDETLW
ncbi:glycosyl transferase [Scheffersomyces spartinae]|uniref:Alpha-1,3-glucosyltransferase n=1 Tax=Scheffersomyces spartinae TaxID=45513 RepID=A0A9P8AGU2_9ASCO|nr:glycosyl transferase [Scheffersomyces spartinae]KAG7191997.1 glycosyl transferase [Scheffersomyces spartinae]